MLKALALVSLLVLSVLVLYMPVRHSPDEYLARLRQEHSTLADLWGHIHAERAQSRALSLQDSLDLQGSATSAKAGPCSQGGRHAVSCSGVDRAGPAGPGPSGKGPGRQSNRHRGGSGACIAGHARGPDGRRCAKLKKAEKESWKEVQRRFALHVMKPWPQLIRILANEVTPEQLRDGLARLVKKGITRQTNVFRSYLHAAFVQGAHSDPDPRRAAEEAATFRLSANPVALLPRIKEFEGTLDRVLSGEEFRFLWKLLGAIRREIELAIRCLILLGGQRAKQLLRATWSDYDPDDRLLTSKDPKGKQEKALQHPSPALQARHAAHPAALWTEKRLVTPIFPN